MISVFTLTSALHDPSMVEKATEQYLSSLKIDYVLKKEQWQDYGKSDLDILFIRTGGTEGIFKGILPTLLRSSSRPIYLLASSWSNSLAASMEILSYLGKQGLKGEIIHGSNAYVGKRLKDLERMEKAFSSLKAKRFGVIGKPSDWLISSQADYSVIKDKLGIELVDIPMNELLGEISAVAGDETSARISFGKSLFDASDKVKGAASGAYRIYQGLKNVIDKHNLSGFTLRCFDLLSTVRNTGCFALAKLNSEGFVAGCEGDVPAMLSMVLGRVVTGVSGFQANPSSIDPQTGEVVFAHCTIPFDMVTRYSLDTHFESGIGVGIRGHMLEGPVTVFKVSGDLSRCFAAEGTLLRNQSREDLCRTQVVLHLDDTSYFLNNPIGNHHIILPGHCAADLRALLG